MSYSSNDITVFIFCHDGYANPARTLDGLQVQTVTPGRIVIVDNGIEPALALDPFFSARTGASMALVRTPAILPEGKRLNFAVDTCSSEICMTIGADLIPPPDWVELLLLALAPHCQCLAAKGSHIAGVGGRVSWLLPDEHQQDDNRFDLGRRPSTNPDAINLDNAVFRMDFLRKVNGFSPDLAGTDLARDLIQRLRREGGEVLYMPEIHCGRI